MRLQGLNSCGVWVVATVFLVAAGHLCTATLAADADALLEFKSAIPDLNPSGWSSSNIAGLCSSWAGVQCDSNNRVRSLALDTVNRIFGNFSTSLLQLDALERLLLSNIIFLGDCPTGLFQLPIIEDITLRGLRCKLAFPQQPSSSIRNVFMTDIQVKTPIPNTFNWPRMNSFTLTNGQTPCPLPQGLIDRARRSSSNDFVCSIEYNKFAVVDGHVCNQVSLADLACRNLPQLPKAYISSASPKTVRVASYGSMHLEFEDYTVRIFAKTRAGTVHRDDYFSLNFAPLQPLLPLPGIGYLGFVSTPFQSVRWLSSGKDVSADFVLSNRLNQVMRGELKFQFDPPNGNVQINGQAVKFSYRLENINVTKSSNRTMFMFNAAYHTPHSPEGGLPLSCASEFDPYKFIACSNSVSNLTFSVGGGRTGYFVDSSTVGLQNSRVDMRFSYGLIGTIDGAQLLEKELTSILAERYLDDLGFSTDFFLLQQGGRPDLIPRANAAQNQTLTTMIGLNMPSFDAILDYDPDISLSLLFDTQDPPVSSLQLDQSSNTVALAAGISVGIVVVAGITIGAVVYLRIRTTRSAAVEAVKRRLASGAEVTSPVPTSPATEAPTAAETQRWTSPSLTQIKTTNVALDD